MSKSARILVVDDELSMREFLAILLEREGYRVESAEGADRALQLMGEYNYDLVISDVNMPGLNGLQLLERIKCDAPHTAVLLITAYSTAESAVEAMKLGAYDYLAKPFKVEEIKVLVHNALEKRDLQQENLRLKREIEERFGFAGLVGKSRQMRELYSLIEKVAASSANVLVSGESGTGKELVAKAIHYNGPRQAKPFLAINCGAIPESLMESELFGYRKGAFTGAVTDRSGLFEQADGGTLFLDEIGEIPLQVQAKLLRVIQEREVRRVGGNEARQVDVRLIAATNRILEEQVRQGAFREDLFYRLNVVELRLPPLRERTDDIPLLLEHFHRKFAGRREGGEAITAEALAILLNYPFPGNVRELENIVERSLVLCSGPIGIDSLPDYLRRPTAGRRGTALEILPVDGMDLEVYLAGLEKHFLLQALERSGGVKKRAAELLGMSFRSFRYRLAKFGMDDE